APSTTSESTARAATSPAQLTAAPSSRTSCQTAPTCSATPRRPWLGSSEAGGPAEPSPRARGSCTYRLAGGRFHACWKDDQSISGVTSFSRVFPHPARQRRRPDFRFSKLDTQPIFSPVYASLDISQRPVQNSGPSGLLLLSREALSSPLPCRFSPAHPDIRFAATV